MRFFAALLFLMLIIPLAASQGTVLIPTQEVEQGRLFTIRYNLHGSFGDPILGAQLKTRSDFFEADLYDDGQHDDNKANDGIYGNMIKADTKPGVYFVDIFYNNRSIGSITVKVLEKPLLSGVDAMRYFALTVGLVASFYFVVYRGMMLPKKRIHQLELKRKSMEESIKKAEKEYFSRVIDSQTFERMVAGYKQEMIRVDIELKELKVKKEAANKSG